MSHNRLLFTCRPLAGHYEPLAPLARAAKQAGLAVAFATGEPFVGRARDAGFEAFPAGPDEDFRFEWAPRFPGYDRLVGDDQRRFFFTEIFANLELVPRAADLEPIVDNWEPDAVVHEIAELAAPLVCVARGLPCIDVSYGPLIPFSLLRAAGQAAAPHWRIRGLEPDPLAGLLRYLYVDTCPPSLQNPEVGCVPAVQPLRPAAADLDENAPPHWLQALNAPIVYVTLGTIWNRDLDVFRCVIEALREQPLSIVATVGLQNDPSAVGEQPANVVVHRYIPQGRLLPHCHAVVAHGGAGTTLGALAAGLPLLVLPQGADQYTNADRVVAAGAGRRLLPDELSSETVRDSVATLLENPGYRTAAHRIRSEIRAMPPPSDVVAAIEALLKPGASSESGSGCQ